MDQAKSHRAGTALQRLADCLESEFRQVNRGEEWQEECESTGYDPLGQSFEFAFGTEVGTGERCREFALEELATIGDLAKRDNKLSRVFFRNIPVLRRVASARAAAVDAVAALGDGQMAMLVRSALAEVDDQSLWAAVAGNYLSHPIRCVVAEGKVFFDVVEGESQHTQRGILSEKVVVTLQAADTEMIDMLRRLGTELISLQDGRHIKGGRPRTLDPLAEFDSTLRRENPAITAKIVAARANTAKIGGREDWREDHVKNVRKTSRNHKHT